MTCVLSMSSIYNNPCGGFGGSKEDVSTPPDTDYDYNWITAPPSSRLSDSPCSCRFNNHTTMCRTTVLDNRLITAEKQGGKTDENKNEMGEIFMEQDKRNIGVKRKLDNDIDDLIDKIPPKRISPFLNTPKERKEERRKVLKMSVQKLRRMEDPEHFLCRSVLINNTLKKVQKEIREEKQKRHQGYKSCIYRLRPSYDYDVLNNSYLHSTPNGYVSVFEDPFVSPGDTEKLSDDIADSLVESIEGKENEVESCQMPRDVSNDTQKEKQMCSEMDTVFNNLIRVLGES